MNITSRVEAQFAKKICFAKMDFESMKACCKSGCVQLDYLVPAFDSYVFRHICDMKT